MFLHTDHMEKEKGTWKGRDKEKDTEKDNSDTWSLLNGAASHNTCPLTILKLKFQCDRLKKGLKLNSKEQSSKVGKRTKRKRKRTRK